jgi:hypothetical protein
MAYVDGNQVLALDRHRNMAWLNQSMESQALSSNNWISNGKTGIIKLLIINITQEITL